MMNCKVGGCPTPVPRELHDHSLCVEHFLNQVQDRIHGFAQQLDFQGPSDSLQQTAMQFIVLTAAKIATLGTQNPPSAQLVRGRMLNAMLLLAELRERFDKLPRQRPSP